MAYMTMHKRLAMAFFGVAITVTAVSIVAINTGMFLSMHGPVHIMHLLGMNFGPNMDMESTRWLILRWSLIIGVGAIVVSLVAARVVSRRINRPLRLLVEATSRLRIGDLNYRAPEVGDMEIRELAKSFNEMANRLAEEDNLRRQLIADVTHELGHPLTILQGRLEMMIDGLASPDPHTLNNLQNEVLHIKRLVTDLRTVSLAEAGGLTLQMVNTRIDDLVTTVVEAIGTLADTKDVTITASAEPDLPMIQVDPEKMRQVMTNLLINAVRYTPVGGEIKVSVTHDKDHISIAVKDTGCGIPAEELPYVFNRFYRVDKSRTRATGGSGLGLAIAKNLVELHKGTISVTSSVGTGSTFTVKLPVLS